MKTTLRKCLTRLAWLFVTAQGAFAQSAGSPVPLFASSGSTTFSVANQSDYIMTTKIDAAGNIFSTGICDTGGIWFKDVGFFISKHLPNGAPDLSFGKSGIFKGFLPGGAFLTDLFITSAGDILAAGGTYSVPHYPIVIKLKANGTYDASFGNNGMLVVSTLPDVSGKRLLPADQNKIMVMVSVETISDFDIGFIKITPGGSIDGSFGINGLLQIKDPLKYQIPEAMTLAQNGNYVFAFREYVNYPDTKCGMMSVSSAGVLDNSFGSGGKAILSSPLPSGYCVLTGLCMQNDGKLIATGYSIEDLGGGLYDNHFMLTRLSTNGTPDNSFGTAGTVISDLYIGSENACASAVQSDGKIVTAGTVNEPYPSMFQNVGVARYLSNGALDPSFGTNGWIKEPLRFLEGKTTVDIGIMPDKGILVSGHVWEDDSTGFFDCFYAKYKSGLSVVTTAIAETGIEDSGMMCYPNPASDLITIHVNNLEGADLRAELINNLGQHVYSTPLEDQSATISTADLPAGLYMVSLFKEGELVKSCRILVRKE